MQTQTFPRSEGTKNKNCPICFQTAHYRTLQLWSPVPSDVKS